jgi:hypothetical protein
MRVSAQPSDRGFFLVAEVKSWVECQKLAEVTVKECVGRLGLLPVGRHTGVKTQEREATQHEETASPHLLQ